jgi:hypothetical protein
MARQPSSISRRRTALPGYEPGFVFRGSDAWIDRLVLEFPEHQLVIPAGRTITSILRHLCGRGGLLTGLPGTGSRNYITLTLRENVAPLLHLSFVFQRRNDRVWSLKVIMHLNPTRLLAHCNGNIEQLRDWSPQSYMAPADERRQEIANQTLDGNDNFFPDTEVRRTVNLERREVNLLSIRSATQFVEHIFGQDGQQLPSHRRFSDDPRDTESH